MLLAAAVMLALCLHYDDRLLVRFTWKREEKPSIHHIESQSYRVGCPERNWRFHLPWAVDGQIQIDERVVHILLSALLRPPSWMISLLL